MTLAALLVLLLCRPCRPSPHTMVAKPGAGATLIATRAIRTGELLVDEEPLIALAHSRDNEAAGGNSGTWFAPSDSYVLNLLEAQLDRLSDDDYKAYYELFGFCGAGVDRASNALDIFKTNAYPLDSNGKVDMIEIISSGAAAGRVERQPRKRSRAGVYRTISRINHSCLPNVCYSFDSSSGRGSIHAIRDIPNGAELLNSYIPLLAPASERKQYLATNFGFACDCRACRSAYSSSDVYRLKTPGGISTRMRSDERRCELKRLKDQVERDVGALQGGADGGSDALLTAVDRANHRRLELLGEEDIATPDLVLNVLESQLCAALLTGAGGDATLRLCSQAHVLSVLSRGALAGDTLALRRAANELRSCDDLSI